MEEIENRIDDVVHKISCAQACSSSKKRKLETELTNLECVKIKTKLQSTQGGNIDIDGSITPSTSNESSLLREKWKDLRSAFNKRLKTGLIVNIDFKDPKTFLLNIKAIVFEKLESMLKKYAAFKISFNFCCKFILPLTEEIENKYFSTANKILNKGINLSEVYAELINVILIKMEEFQERGSGWSLLEVSHLLVSIAKYDPLRGGGGGGGPSSTYMDLPDCLKRKKALINVRNQDRRCFLWSILCQLYPPDVGIRDDSDPSCYPQNLHEIFNLKGIEFPIKISDISKFENQNKTISVNVYGWDKGTITGPLYITKQEKTTHVNLLFITKRSSSIGHYCYIKDMSKLCSAQYSKGKRKIFICNFCLQNFSNEEKLTIHKSDCATKTPVKIEYPNEQFLKFTKHCATLKTPFAVFADFECLLSNVDTCNPNATNTSFTNIYQKHVPYSVAYMVTCSFSEKLSHFEMYRGNNPEQWFVNQLRKEVNMIESEYRLANQSKMIISDEEQIQHDQQTLCNFCDSCFTIQNYKVRHHDHFSRKYICAACNTCNLKAKSNKFIPVIFHNLSSYDGHIFISNLNFDNKGIDIIPVNNETYIAFQKKIGSFQLRFIDSLRFLNASLDNLSMSLDESDFVYTKQAFPNIDSELILRKGIFPYDYVSDNSKLNETSLPSIEQFYSKLKDENVSKIDYDHAHKVWNMFQCKTLGDYSDIYLKIDVLLLTDIFERFRKLSLKYYNLDPTAFYTVPGLTFQAALKLSKVELEYLKDPDMILLFERGIRGGIAQSVHRYAEANNKYVRGYNPNKQTSYILYVDANNLYAYAMNKKLPYRNFKWINNNEIEHMTNVLQELQFSNLDYGQGAEKSCILEVELIYPTELHDAHCQLPFCPEHLVPGKRKNSQVKLITTLGDKRKYIMYYDNLEQCLRHGLKLKKIYRAIEFDHSNWLSEYIMLNTNLRTTCKSKFEKDFFKLLNNSMFGKTIEDVRKHRKIVLVSDWKSAQRYIVKPNFKSFKIFNENLISIEMNKTSVKFNKPIYVGLCVLELSKILMYDFHYNYIMSPKISNTFSAKLLYMDTDSFIYHFSNINESDTITIYDLIKRDAQEYFDTSEYPADNCYHIPQVNAKVIGKFKDELNGKTISRFVSLRAKVYAIETNNDDFIKKNKGIGKTLIRRLTFDDYCNALFKNETKIGSFNLIHSIDHNLYSLTVNKKCLDSSDDKRVIMEDKIHTLPYNHYLLDRSKQ